MAVSIVLDVTADFNADGSVKLDTGGSDYTIVQIMNPTGSIFFTHTNYSDDIQGVSDGSAVSSTYYNTLQGINLATGLGVTFLAASGIVRFEHYGRYLQLDGSGVTADKVLVRLFKIC